MSNEELICHRCRNPIKYPFKAIWIFGKPYHQTCVHPEELRAMKLAKAQSNFFRS